MLLSNQRTRRPGVQEIEAAVIERAGLPPTIETLLLDDPHPGEVLVRMTA